MSAYVVSDKHINALVTMGMGYRALNLAPQQTAELLKLQNVRSVAYRYREQPEPASIEFSPLMAPLSAVETLKACSCYEYQACETPDWESTEAYAFIGRVRVNAIASLPGYEKAAWEIRD